MSDLTVVMSSDEQRVLRGLQKVIDKERELAQKAAEAGAATEGAARRSASEIDKLGDKIRKAAQDMISWQGATAALRTGYEAVLQVVDRVLQAQREAADFVKSSAGGLEALGGLAGGNRERFNALMGHVQRVYPTVGGPDMNAAAKLVSDVVAAGFEDAATIDFFARQNRALGGESGKAATAIAALQKSMGVDETGDVQAVMAKAAIAAERAPGGVPEVLKYVAKSGGTARALGMTDEELLAAFATVAQSASNPEMGGTQLSALVTKAGALGHTGDLMPFVQRIAEQGVPVTEGRGRNKTTRMSREVKDIIAYLGSDDAFRAYSALALNQSDTAADRARMTGARSVDLAGAFGDSPLIQAERFAREAEARDMASRARAGALLRARQGVIAGDAAQARSLGVPDWLVEASAWNERAQAGLEGAAPFIGANALDFARRAMAGPLGFLGMDPTGARAEEALGGSGLERNTAATEENSRLMREQNGGGGSPRVLPGENR